jgi:hypothetical protein
LWTSSVCGVLATLCTFNQCAAGRAPLSPTNPPALPCLWQQRESGRGSIYLILYHFLSLAAFIFVYTLSGEAEKKNTDGVVRRERASEVFEVCAHTNTQKNCIRPAACGAAWRGELVEMGFCAHTPPAL